MTCLFIGGPLDGELRDVPDGCCFGAREGALYFYGNGIARHESVSEEEVARRVANWVTLLKARKRPDGGPADCIDLPADAAEQYGHDYAYEGPE